MCYYGLPIDVSGQERMKICFVGVVYQCSAIELNDRSERAGFVFFFRPIVSLIDSIEVLSV